MSERNIELARRVVEVYNARDVEELPAVGSTNDADDAGRQKTLGGIVGHSV